MFPKYRPFKAAPGKKVQKTLIYYPNTTASFNLELIGDLNLQLNPGPTPNGAIAILTLTSPIDINVPTTSALILITKDYFVLLVTNLNNKKQSI